MRAFAVDSSTPRSSLAGRCRTLLCGRPFFRRILSSLHREPDRRKRNAHCSAFRQSLHCLIAKRFRDMQLGFLSGGRKEHSKSQPFKVLQVLTRCNLWSALKGIASFHTPSRDLTHHSSVLHTVFFAGRKLTLTENWRELPALAPRNAKARTSSSCNAMRLG